MARHASRPELKPNKLGYYTIYWTDNGRSKRLSTGTMDQSDAATFFAKWLRARHLPPPEGDEWNVSTLLSIYYTEQIEGGPSDERTKIIIATLKRAFGTSSPAILDASYIQRYVRERAQGLHGKRKANDSTARRELTVLIAALNHAVRQRRMSADAFPHIDRPDDGDAKETVIPESHLDAILRNASGRLKTFVIFAYETASRRNAIETLRWGRISIGAGLVNFLPGGTVKRRVAVPISPKLMDHILEITHGNLPGSADFVLGDDRQVYDAWRSLMVYLSGSTGETVFMDYTPHDLRRTWATNAARRGVSMFDIAGVLGDSVAVVTKHYAKHSPEYLRRAMA